MNAKYRAKPPRRRAAVLALTASLVPFWAAAEDGGITQQLRVQQHKNRFQLMLEQVQAQARRRAALENNASARAATVSPPTDLGDATESMRLKSMPVTEPARLSIDPENAAEFRTRQAYERDQQRILDQRQQRRALIAGPRTGSVIGTDSFSANRNELVRFNTQNQKQRLQRKLRN